MRDKMLQLAIAAVLIMPAFADAAGVIQLPATGQTACFNAGGNPIICAGTGQDGELRKGVPWQAATRFTDNANGTVTDNLTGLMWTKDANAPDPAGPAPAIQVCLNSRGDMVWQDALSYITCLNTNSYLGFSDWRLPNLNELESLVNAGVADTSAVLISSGFVNVRASQYWSSTSDASNVAGLSAANAWDLDMVIGDFPLSISKTNVALTRAAWPMRGISGAPAQLGRTGQATCFDSAGATIACAGSGQDGEKPAGAVWPVPRFQTNAVGALTGDRLTGLVWTTDGQTPGPGQNICPFTGLNVSWQNALLHVQCLNQNAFLGLTGWRLPNRKEMRSLVDYSQGGPALLQGHPLSAGVGGLFWSSTTDAANTANAWAVNMSDGSIRALNKTAPGNASHVWPVSGPDAVAPALTMNTVAGPSRITTQTVSGTVEAGIIPSVTLNTAATVGAVTVAGTNWSCQISGLQAGANNITVTAIDPPGNVSTATGSITIILPDGSLGGTGTVSIADALKALRISVGLATPTAEEMLHGDCAPLGAPNGVIDLNDALLILRKAIGLASF